MKKDDTKSKQTMKSGWLWAIALTGALMLATGLVWMRFDMVIQAQGGVEAKNALRLYAPREAWVEEILTESGRGVAAGEVLLHLRDESLDREILEVREALLSVRLDTALAQNRQHELTLTGGGLDSLTAEASLGLHGERLGLLEEISGIYEQLSASGSVSRVERLSMETQWLNARRDAMRDEMLVNLKEQGIVNVLLQRQQALEQAAKERTVLLEQRLADLLEERERLVVRSPIEGRVTNLHTREPGMTVNRGQLLLAVAAPGDGYVARMYVQDRNVDLLLPELPVRMASHVFASSSEGYMHGRVLQVVTDVDSPGAGGFEVLVSIDQWPVEPVIGSRVNAEILLRKQSLMGLIAPRPLRNPPPTAEKESPAHGS